MGQRPRAPSSDELDRLRLLSAVVESSDDAILTKSAAGIIQSWNQGAERLYGWTAAEAIGRHISLIVPADRREELDQLMDRVTRGEPVDHLETERVARDGRRIHVSLSLSPVDLGTRGRGIAAIARDITSRRLAEVRLRRSEERLHTVIESLTAGLVIADLEGRLLHWNRAGLAMHGFSTMDEVLRPLHAFTEMFELATLDGRVLPVSEWPMARVIRGEALRNLPLWVRRLDSGQAWILSYSGTVVTEPDGTPLAVLSIIDITSQRLAEDRFRQVFEACPEGMLVVDAEGRIVMANREVTRMFGYAPGALPGQVVEALLPERFRDGHRAWRDEFGTAPRHVPMVGRGVRGRRLDGSEFPAEVGLSPLESGEGRLVLAVVTDVTMRDATARALARHQEELERSNRELSQFAYVASHDLQEPLRMVASYTELFAERYADQVDPRAAKYVEYIVGGARRMQTLVNDLLAYARVDARGKPMVPTDPGRCLASLRHDLGRAIAEADAAITVEELPAVWADPGQLRELLQNLLANALKFRAAPPVRITIDAVREGELVRFGVHDNGIGIEAGGRERIFGMFQRLHGRDEYPGSGIGLAIARKIVERHGGRIWIDPARQDGTTVYFTLWPADGPTPELTREARA